MQGRVVTAFAVAVVLGTSAPYGRAWADVNVHAARVPQPSHPNDIVGLVLQNPLGSLLPAHSITFGEVFLPGQVKAGEPLAAMSSGHEIPVQIDSKTSYADGSVRMAVVTLIQPALPAGGSADLMLVHANGHAGPPVDIANLHGFDLAVDLTVQTSGGPATQYHLDAASVLAAALKAGTASPWLRGPLATEVRVDAPITGSLHVAFDIRAYADGTTLTNVAFDNDIAMQPNGGTLSYDASITQSGHAVLRQSGLTHFQYQTWNWEVWSGGSPEVNIVHDVAALEATGAVLGYDLSVGVDPAVIADLRHRIASEPYKPLGNAGIVKFMGQTGGRPEIGPVTLWNAIWLITQQPDAARYALEQARAAGSVPWHFWDPKTRTYITTDAFPTLWAGDYRAGTGGTLALSQTIPLNPAGDAVSGWAPDTAHVPSLSYVAYLLTGTRYWLDQTEAQATGDILETWPGARHDGTALVATHDSQVRGGAWALRDLVHAAYAAPDDDPMRPYLRSALDRNFDYLLQDSRAKDQGEPHGYLIASGPTTAAWQQDFLSSTLLLAAGQGSAKAKRLVEWQTNFTAGRFLAAERGFSPYGAATYYLSVADSAGHPLPTWADVQRATIASGMGNDGRSWPASTLPDMLQITYGVLAAHITVTGAPASMKALGWLVSHARDQVGPTGLAQSVKWNIAPRLPDGRVLLAENIRIAAGPPGTVLRGGNADQMLIAEGKNTLVGGPQANVLVGGSGGGTLIGGPGRDWLFGGSGSDTLYGGNGDNYMEAGTGPTTFQVDVKDAAHDLIAGFRPDMDRIAVLGTEADLDAVRHSATTDENGDLMLRLSGNHSVTMPGLKLADVGRLILSSAPAPRR